MKDKERILMWLVNRLYASALYAREKIIKWRDMQRWCNNRIIYRSCPDFMQYVPRKDGKTIKEIYFKGE